jgi:hypothetical protein
MLMPMMNDALDQLIAQLAPEVAPLSFVPVAERHYFVNRTQALQFIFSFSVDGRGGMLWIRGLDCLIFNAQDAVPKKMDEARHSARAYFHTFKGGFDRRIPQLYSPAALELANKMALRQLKLMPMTDKYPLIQAKQTAHAIADVVKNDCWPHMQTLIQPLVADPEFVSRSFRL